MLGVTDASMLAPYRVLDLTDGRAELATFVLAGLGADVIKVEPPGGSPSRREGPLADGEPAALASLRFHAFNRGKRSVVLDLDDAAGRARLPRPRGQRRLRVRERRARARWTRAGSASRRCARSRPDLVYVAISPFGQTGPYAAPPRHRPHARRDGRGDGAQRRARPPAGAHHRAADVAPRRRRERARRAGRPPAPAADRRGPVRRRVGAGGGVLDRPQRDDRPRHPGPEHRAQRHRAAAQHARHAARVPVRRRRGRASSPRRRTLVGLVPWMVESGAVTAEWADAEDWTTYEARMLTGRRRSSTRSTEVRGGDHRVHAAAHEDGAVRGRHRPRRHARAR